MHCEVVEVAKSGKRIDLVEDKSAPQWWRWRRRRGTKKRRIPKQAEGIEVGFDLDLEMEIGKRKMEIGVGIGIGIGMPHRW